MEYQQNEQLLLAAEFVEKTGEHIFLTGKAGTGKTTFLRQLPDMTPKRTVIVAPTGVAAINAGGVTIHSFFQLDFGPAVPGAPVSSDRTEAPGRFRQKFSREKIRLIKSIDLLVIDEISMVRADVLDAVDEVLRRYRNRYKPFGGVQLLMIGDLHQLSPVVKDADWQILRDYYRSMYFFESHALQKTSMVTIELKEIFRQADLMFISLLNRVRENVKDPQTIGLLNSRHIPGFNPADEEGYITLTTHNAIAAGLNSEKLLALKGKPHHFRAVVEGEFPAYDFPTAENLELRPGAQVMFIKNDPSADKLYYNGKIGKVTRIEEDSVFVKCPSDHAEIEAGSVTWENVKYTLNDTTREIETETAGTFTQVPLKLAWAITIHKSQGLTFDRVIIDAKAAFASGQVYVALSRCRTFEGIVLSTPILPSGIRTDALVADYSDQFRQSEPGVETLLQSKRRFQEELIAELFDFKPIRSRFDNLFRQLREHNTASIAKRTATLTTLLDACETGIFSVANKFRPQLVSLFVDGSLPEENSRLQERIVHASVYFAGQLRECLSRIQEMPPVESDNKATQKTLTEMMEKLEGACYIRLKCLDACTKRFDSLVYMRTRSDADAEFKPSRKKQATGQKETRGGVSHPGLYAEIRDWRNATADVLDIPRYMVLPQNSIEELSVRRPTTPAALKSIKGIGKARIKRFGGELIELIRNFCKENGIDIQAL